MSRSMYPVRSADFRTAKAAVSIHADTAAFISVIQEDYSSRGHSNETISNFLLATHLNTHLPGKVLSPL